MRRKRLVLALLLPAVVALHLYLAWLGGFWRVLAIGDLAVGAFLVLAMREARRIDSPTDGNGGGTSAAPRPPG